MLKDTLLFIKALLHFVTAALNLLYRGAKVVQYAFVAWLVYRLFRNVEPNAPTKETSTATTRLHSQPNAQRARAPMRS